MHFVFNFQSASDSRNLLNPKGTLPQFRFALGANRALVYSDFDIQRVIAGYAVKRQRAVNLYSINSPVNSGCRGGVAAVNNFRIPACFQNLFSRFSFDLLAILVTDFASDVE